MKENDDIFDISDEFTKSLEKLVEEETNVAKAYVKNGGDIKSGSGSGSSLGDTRILGNTQMFDSEELKKSVGGVNIDDLLDEDDKEELLTETPAPRKKPASAAVAQNRERVATRNAEKRAEIRRNRIIIAGVAAVVIVAIIGIVIAAVAMSNKNKNSYEYNIEQGNGSYESQDYSSAITYYKKAYVTSEGKKDLELMYNLYDCYAKLGDTVLAQSMLSDMISYDKYNEKAIKALGKSYRDTRNGAGVNELLKKYRDTSGAAHIAEFEVTAPTASETPGTFSESVKLTLFADTGCDIYYTTDGSEPTTSSPKFTEEIVIKAEEVVVKAIAVDSIGVVSVVSEFKYKVDYAVPDGPVFNISSGTIDTDTVLEISNLGSGDTAYYTIDGTTPTAESAKYENGISLEKGSYVLSAIIISKNGDVSKIVRNTYVVNEVKLYSYEECVRLLKDRMIALNILNSNGMTTTDGEKASFYYDSKKTLDDVEMYIIKYVVTTSAGESTQGYYGVGTKSGSCYKVTVTADEYSAVKY